jgi:hypothetical protein
MVADEKMLTVGNLHIPFTYQSEEAEWTGAVGKTGAGRNEKKTIASI